jgi:hypothetical protein
MADFAILAHMDSNHPSFELPGRSPEVSATDTKTEVANAPQSLPSPEVAGPLGDSNIAAQQLTTQPSQPQPPVNTVPPLAPPSGSGTAPPPQIADDVDVIEREWVDKAKTIVEATKEDPHVQTKEISRFKADYMKKRYNKDVKVAE